MTARRRGRRIAAALATVAACTAALAACGDGGSGDSPRTVTVVGSGKVTGTPDTLRATIGIQTEGANVSSTLNDASAKVKRVTDAVVAAGVDRKDIQTQTVTINPRYSSPAPGGTGQISGYEATNSLRVIMRDIPKASDVLAKAADAGGDNTRISGVSFAIDDNTELLKKARDSAFADARSRAEQYAKLAGDSLGKVITIKETTGGQNPSADEAPTARTFAAPVPLEPGEQTVTFDVTVTYGLT